MTTFKEIIETWNTYINYSSTISPYVFKYKHSDKVVALFSATDYAEFYGPKALENAMLASRKLSQEENIDLDSTKVCSMCGNTKLTLLRTHNLKWCCKCGNKIPWRLGEGQSSIQ